MKRWILGLFCLGLTAHSAWAAGLLWVDEARDSIRVLPGIRESDSILPLAPRPPHPPRPSLLQPIETVSTKADVVLKDQRATVRIDQEFYNPNNRACEGTFLFPVPKGAQLDQFTLTINGKPVDAELLRADKARQIYEDIVRRSLDPALLEYVGRDLFKVRIFPIEPHARRQISLTYTQIVPEDSGVMNWVLPLRVNGTHAQPIKSLSVRVKLESKLAIKSLYSPSHKVEIVRQGDHSATVGFEISNFEPESDFQLFVSRAASEFGLDLMTYRKGDEEGYFLLLATSQNDPARVRVTPKDVVFVLDASGSMAGAKLEQAKRALKFCFANLNNEDRFEVLRFSTEVEPVFQGLKQAGTGAREEAAKFVENVRPTGGTAIHDALLHALALRPAQSERSFVVVFLTDGRPTVGVSAEDAIVDSVLSRAKSGETPARVFCFGIGSDLNTHLLDRITEATKSASTYVLADEDIEVKISTFFSRIKDPVLTDLALHFPEGIRATKLYPHALPELYKGQQLVLVGRYTGQGTGSMRLSGKVSGETRELRREVSFTAAGIEHEFLPRLWATRRVGYLLDEIRLRGESSELKDEVVELARKFAIVTPYTAYLVTEDETRRGVAQSRQSFQWLDRDGSREELKENFRALTREKSGDLAVAGARSFDLLKLADAPTAAIQLGLDENLRIAPAVPAIRGQSRSFSSALNASTGGSTADPKAAKRFAELESLPQSSRYLGGRSFYFNGTQWVDSSVQSNAQQTPQRIAFASEEYFKLLQRHPEARGWMALGTELQFVIGSTLYEIYTP